MIAASLCVPAPGLVTKELAEGRKDGGVGRVQRHGEVGALQVRMGRSVL